MGATTSIKIPVDGAHVDELRAGLAVLMATFAEKQKAERPKRWESMECRLIGMN